MGDYIPIRCVHGLDINKPCAQCEKETRERA